MAPVLANLVVVSNVVYDTYWYTQFMVIAVLPMWDLCVREHWIVGFSEVSKFWRHVSKKMGL